MTSGHGPHTAGRAAVVEELARAGFSGAVEVGRGGFGVVYRCFQMALNRTVAIKLLQTDLDTVSRERFFREGRAMGGLSGHPNVVDVLQVGVTPSGRPYIVMPYQALDSLAQRVRREGPVPWAEAVRMGVRLAGALESAHRVGTLHRDVKPANVLLSDYGEAQLTDFGIARIEGGFETTTGAFTGSLSYTAPEVLNGDPPTAASDVYGLGATLYTIIAGQAAYERREGEEIIAQFLRITGQPVPDLRTLGVPDDLAALVEHAMAKEPAERPATAAEFGRALQEIQRAHGQPVAEMALPLVSRPVLTEDLPDTDVSVDVPDELQDRTAVVAVGDADATRVTAWTGAGPTPPEVSGPRHGPGGHGREVSGPRPELAGRAGEVSGPHRAPTGHGPELSGPKPELAAWAARGGPPAGGPRPRAWLPVAAAVTTVVALLATLVVAAVLLLDRGGPTAAGGSAGSATPASAWRPVADAPTARQQVATTVADGTVWVLGGLTDDGGASTAVENYDPTVNGWRTSPIPLPVPLHHAMAVQYRGEIVVLGGWRPEGADLTAISSTAVYAQRGGSWVELAPLPGPRVAGAAVVVGDRIVVTGGQADGELARTTLVFDGERWREAAPMPTPREHLAMVTDGQYAYAVGGRELSADRNLAALERYDPAQDRWDALAPMPVARGGLGAVLVDGRILAVGGEEPTDVRADVDAFDVKSGTWSPLPPMTTGRHGAAVGAVGRTVYVLGGATEPTHAASTVGGEALDVPARRTQPAAAWRAAADAPVARQFAASTVAGGSMWVAGGLTTNEATTAVQGYDPAIDTWKSAPDLPLPLHHTAAVTWRDQIVVLGGWVPEGGNISAVASDKVFALRDGAWVELPPLPAPRVAMAAAVVGDRIVVVGGQADGALVPGTVVFDGERWTEAAPMPTPREHLAAVSDGSFVYAVGGRQLGADRNVAAFERYDPATDTWVELPALPTPRGGVAAALHDGRIVAAGGEEPTRVLDTVEAYDIDTGTWRALPPLAVARHGLAMAAVGNAVFAVDGARRPGHTESTAAVEVLDFS